MVDNKLERMQYTIMLDETRCPDKTSIA